MPFNFTNISFEENSFNAVVNFEKYGDCSKIMLVYQQDETNDEKVLFDCIDLPVRLKYIIISEKNKDHKNVFFMISL